tara:strand:- start:51703 stop:52863 length:1161 start_codon:yes stop_codon:yes gene_type:complete
MAKENEDGSEKTEDATARKLEKAAQEGSVARSPELTLAATTILGFLCLFLAGSYFVTELIQIFKGAFSFDRKIIYSPFLLPGRFMETISYAIIIFLPLFVLLMVTAIIAGNSVGGLNFAVAAMVPKASKFNPLNGLKRMFGPQALVTLLKAVLKFTLCAGMMFVVIQGQLMDLFALGQMNLEPALARAGEIIIRSAFFVSLALIIIALIDIPYQIYQFNEGQKMTKQEVKDEMKDMEGSPEVKKKIRQKQQEMANAQMMEKVKDADVVITNPEHFSVALSYDPTSDSAPLVLAKGADFIALKIREEAKKHGVEVFSAPPLARALYFTTNINEAVPPDLYYAVAQVIAYVFNLNSLSRDGLPPSRPSPDVPSSMEFDAEGNQLKKAS